MYPGIFRGVHLNNMPSNFSGVIINSDNDGNIKRRADYLNGIMVRYADYNGNVITPNPNDQRMALPDQCVLVEQRECELFTFPNGSQEMFCDAWHVVGMYGNCFGNGGGYVPVVEVDDNVIDNLTSECFKAALNKITDSKLNSFISKLFKDTYSGAGNNVTLKLSDYNDPNDPSLAHSGLDPNNSNVWWIQLNRYNLDPGTLLSQNPQRPPASLETVTSSILHEIIHHFINRYHSQIVSSSYAHHRDMFINWVNHTRNTLQEIFPSMSNYNATALALGGMDNVFDNYAFDPIFFVDIDIECLANYGMTISAAHTTQNNFGIGALGEHCGF
jgi:hypothetical protein